MGYAWRYDEGFYTEAADEGPVAYTLVVGSYIALIPGHPERFIWHLDDKKIEVSIGW